MVTRPSAGTGSDDSLAVSNPRLPHRELTRVEMLRTERLGGFSTSGVTLVSPE